MKNEWWYNISFEIQKAFNKKDLKLFYSLMRTVFGPLTSSIAPLRSKDNITLIKEPEKILQRWQQHFTDLFNNPSVVSADVLQSLPQQETKYEMDHLPTFTEFEMAIKQINSGRAPGLDGLPVELLKFKVLI